MNQLHLDILKEGLPAVSPSVGGYFAEAGAFCLEREGHAKGVVLQVEGEFEISFKVTWDMMLTAQIANTWNETEEATQFGAVGISLALVLKLFDLTVVLRSRRGSGVDYWLGKEVPGQPPLILAGIEITGIRQATDKNTIPDRIRLKRKQTDQSLKLKRPIYIAVVEFSQPKAHFVKK